MLKDLLLLGEKAIDNLVPGKVAFIENLSSAARTRSQAAAMYFFMLSHFIADVSMPCHCDARKLSAYDKGLHKELEGYWSHTVGTGFDKTHILTEDIPPDQLILNSGISTPNLNFLIGSPKSPGINKNHDVWLEAVGLLRLPLPLQAFLHLTNSMRMAARHPAPFNKVLGDAHPELLESVSKQSCTIQS